MTKPDSDGQTLAELTRSLDRRRLPWLRIRRSSPERRNDVGYTLRMDWRRASRRLPGTGAHP